MNPERWRKIDRIYNSALELEPGRRKAFLDESCANDADLRHEVERLLERQAKADNFMECPAVEVAAKALFGESPGNSVETLEKKSADDNLKNLPPAKPGQTESDPGSEETRGKRSKRAPWWIYPIAAAFLIWIAVRQYTIYAAPELPGISTKVIQGKEGSIGARVISVTPNSAAARAGLEAGDTILISQSDGFLSSGGEINLPYLESGRSYRLKVNRNEKTETVLLTLKRRSSVGLVLLLRMNIDALFLILAIFVIVSKPRDPAARWGALMMAMISGGFTGTISMSQPGLYTNLMKFSQVTGWIAMIVPSIGITIASSVILTFFSIFPRALFRQRWIWAVIWSLSIFSFSYYVLSDTPPYYSFPRWRPAWYEAFLWVLPYIVYAAEIIVPVANYRRCRDINERRRVRMVIIGWLGYFISGLPLFRIIVGRTTSELAFSLPQWIILAIESLGLAFPFLIAYAILRHRVFDIRVIIRLGLQYAAARGALLSLVPLVAVMLAVDLFLHRGQPLEAIMRQRGLLYAIMAGGGLLLHLRRKVWLDALDRRFFRERYDAQRVLRSVIDEIRDSADFEKVAPHVVSQIETALHPEFAAVLVRKPGESKYRVLAAGEKPPPPIPSDSKLMALIRLLGKPVEISQSQTDWLKSQLPAEESDFLRKARLEWIFPISLTEGQTEGLLALGLKRSEEPYSKEDQELLQGITGSLALILERTFVIPQNLGGYQECPTCGICYDSGLEKCSKEGSKLIQQSHSRLLDDRYRFEQRLGEGGMGTVYRAYDTGLARHVAVKLIRSDLTSSVAATERFKQEARAAASFAHPNVVAIHDFGIAKDRRAYLIMELLQGATLRQELKQSGRFSSARASEVLGGICAALDAAHRRRLLHRDLKPENIFLSNVEGAESPKILDFGVAKRLSESATTQSAGQTGPGVLVGTLKYMSPEQLRGDDPSESWDLWALAVVAYEILSGIYPFSGSTMSEVRIAILNGRVKPFHMSVPGAPATLQNFFERALAPELERRPKSSLQFLADFKESVQ